MSKRIPKNLKLPGVPSALIRVALDDLIRIEKDARYKVNMGHWHQPLEQDEFRHPPVKKCEVCFGGVVIAGRIDDPTLQLTAYCFTQPTYHRLLALDCFRYGDLEGALLVYMKINNKQKAAATAKFGDLGFNIEIVSYRDDPKQFKKDMRGLARKLESIGL